MAFDYEKFKSEILKMSTIDLDKYKEKQMKRRIDAIILKNKFVGYEDYVAALKKDPKLYDEFINYLTINVSEFFRNREQWTLLEESILPFIKKNNPGRINIWSAACSTGEEPYSLAMLLSKNLGFDKFKIIATDIDSQVLQKAKSGIYTKKEMAGIPEKYLKEYFSTLDGIQYEVSPHIKKCITFKKHNLLLDAYPNSMDLIVCRNVMIYFTEEAKEDIYKKFNQSLNKEGILFVGNSEQMMQCTKLGFSAYKSFFYKKV